MKSEMSHAEREKLTSDLRKLQPGDRVLYTGWRGPRDCGEGVFLHFVDKHNKKTQATRWGMDNRDGLMIKRDFSADDGRVFRPFVGDGDSIISPLMIAEGVMESWSHEAHILP